MSECRSTSSEIARAECPPDAVRQLVAASASVEAAYLDIDEERFTSSLATMRSTLECVREPLSVPDVVAVHSAEAISAFVQGDVVRTTRTYAAIRQLEPDWRPSDNLAPAGHPLRAAWDASAALPTTREAPPYQAPGGWFVDGLAAREVPNGRPFVLQGLDASGRVVVTLYLRAPPIPDAEAIGLEGAGAEVAEAHLRVALAVGGGFVSSYTRPEGRYSDAWPQQAAAGGGAASAVGLRWTPAPRMAVDANVGLLAAGSLDGAIIDGVVMFAAGPSFGSVDARLRIGIGARALSPSAAPTTTIALGPRIGAEIAWTRERVRILGVADAALAGLRPIGLASRADVDLDVGRRVFLGSRLGVDATAAQYVDGADVAVVAVGARTAAISARVGMTW